MPAAKTLRSLAALLICLGIAIPAFADTTADISYTKFGATRTMRMRFTQPNPELPMFIYTATWLSNPPGGYAIGDTVIDASTGKGASGILEVDTTGNVVRNHINTDDTQVTNSVRLRGLDSKSPLSTIDLKRVSWVPHGPTDPNTSDGIPGDMAGYWRLTFDDVSAPTRYKIEYSSDFSAADPSSATWWTISASGATGAHTTASFTISDNTEASTGGDDGAQRGQLTIRHWGVSDDDIRLSPGSIAKTVSGGGSTMNLLNVDVDGKSSPVDVWTITFTDTSTFQIFGSNFGTLGAGLTNKAFSAYGIAIPTTYWSGTAVAGDQFTFSTSDPGAPPCGNIVTPGDNLYFHTRRGNADGYIGIKGESPLIRTTASIVEVSGSQDSVYILRASAPIQKAVSSGTLARVIVHSAAAAAASRPDLTNGYTYTNWRAVFGGTSSSSPFTDDNTFKLFYSRNGGLTWFDESGSRSFTSATSSIADFYAAVRTDANGYYNASNAQHYTAADVTTASGELTIPASAWSGARGGDLSPTVDDNGVPTTIYTPFDANTTTYDDDGDLYEWCVSSVSSTTTYHEVLTTSWIQPGLAEVPDRNDRDDDWPLLRASLPAQKAANNSGLLTEVYVDADNQAQSNVETGSTSSAPDITNGYTYTIWRAVFGGTSTASPFTDDSAYKLFFSRNGGTTWFDELGVRSFPTTTSSIPDFYTSARINANGYYNTSNIEHRATEDVYVGCKDVNGDGDVRDAGDIRNGNTLSALEAASLSSSAPAYAASLIIQSESWINTKGGDLDPLNDDNGVGTSIYSPLDANTTVNDDDGDIYEWWVSYAKSPATDSDIITIKESDTISVSIFIPGGNAGPEPPVFKANSDDTSLAKADIGVSQTVVLSMRAARISTGGNYQLGTAGLAMTSPMSVTVLNAVAGVSPSETVTYSVVASPSGASAGSLSTNSTFTNASGAASANFTLGSKPGAYVVRTSASDGSIVDTFVAYADGASFPSLTWQMWTPNMSASGTPASVIGDDVDSFACYWWDPQTASDAKWKQYVWPSTIVRGRGYWVKVKTGGVVRVGGASSWDTVGIPLKQGWNMIGSGQYFHVSWNASVRFDSDGLNFWLPGSADVQGLIEDSIYWYAGSGYNWGPSVAYANPALRPGEGYWVKAKQNCTMTVFPNPAHPEISSGSVSQAPVYAGPPLLGEDVPAPPDNGVKIITPAACVVSALAPPSLCRVLRGFRDALMRSHAGRAIVKLYYGFSSRMLDKILRHQFYTLF